MPDNVPNNFPEPVEDTPRGLSETTPNRQGIAAEELPAAIHRDPREMPDRPFYPEPPTTRNQPIDPSQAHRLPSIDSLETGSDLSVFMSSTVSETVRRQALRKWFHLPGFNRRDGLDDYDEDYRQFKPLGDVVTAHLRHQMQRLTKQPVDPCDQIDGPPAMPQSPSRTTVSRTTAANQEGAPVCGANPETALLWSSAYCAHGRVGRPGCTRCRDACVHGAIFFDAQGLKIRPELCRGDGACAAVCPTGSLRPADGESFRMLKEMLADIRKAAGAGPKGVWAVFCGGQTSDETLQGLQEQLRESIVALRCHRPAVPGPEAWLAAMAMGAGRIIVLADAPTPVQEGQLRLARAIIAGLGLDADAWLLASDGPALEEQARRLPLPEPLAPAAWEPSEEKRALLWQAIDHLHDQAPGAPFQVPLGPEAPLGEVRLEPSKCTLCMACVGVCPTGALQHGSDRPQVCFRERDCVQCGLCRQVCPEQAVTLIPRICYDRSHTRSARVLHQADPLCCSMCGAPFATPAMVAAIVQKLSSHWMYQDPSAKDRLTMCRDCRIRSLYAKRPPTPSGGASEKKK